MHDLAAVDTLLANAVFAVPVAIALTLLVLFVRAVRRRKSKHARLDVAQPIATPARTAAPVSAPDIDVRRADDIRKKIETALKRRDNAAVAPLYLALARRYHQDGDVSNAMSALRSAAGYGALHGPRAAHAAARLELAEAAYVAGDLTSACEHWQLARTAYLEDGKTELHAQIDKRMRDNGCPTDWVLTDF